MAFPLLNVIISEAWGQCHFAVSGEICEHGLWGRGGKYMLSVQVWHTRVCAAGRKLPCRARMGRGEWAHLPMVSGSLCGSFLWHEHLRSCSVGSGRPPILATLPELNGRQGEHGSSSPAWKVQAQDEGDSHAALISATYWCESCLFFLNVHFCHMEVSNTRVPVPSCVCVQVALSVLILHPTWEQDPLRPAWLYEVDGLGLVLEKALSVSHREGRIVTFVFLIAHIETLVELPYTACGWHSSGSEDKKQLSSSLELQGWRTCSINRVFSMWGGREGSLGGMRN